MSSIDFRYLFLPENASSFADYTLLSKNKDEHRDHLISSVEGTGKSKFLEELVTLLRTKASNCLVLLIDLSECRGQLEDVKNSGNLIVEDFVGVASCSMGADEEPFQRITLTQNGNQLNENIEGEVWILLDSLDMVCPVYRQEVKQLLALLHEMGANLVVATRPDEEHTVLEILPNINVHRANSLKKARMGACTTSF
jgi:hypothetical protein